jgi:hypothetical protein
MPGVQPSAFTPPRYFFASECLIDELAEKMVIDPLGGLPPADGRAGEIVFTALTGAAIPMDRPTTVSTGTAKRTLVDRG